MQMPIAIALALSVASLGVPAVADEASAPGAATRDNFIQACLANETEKKTTKTDLEMQQYCLDQQWGVGRTPRHVAGSGSPSR